MTVRKMAVCGLLVCTVLAAGACGDDEPKKDTKIEKPRGAAADGKVGNSDPEALVSSLNDAEWKAACIDIAESTNTRELVHGPCIMGALLGSFLGISCQETYELCSEGAPDTDCDSKPTDCEITLRQADECNTSRMLYLAEKSKGLTCSSSPNAILTLGDGYDTPECLALTEKCPSITEMDEDVGDFSDF
jgi:hypothetical protein